MVDVRSWLERLVGFSKYQSGAAAVERRLQREEEKAAKPSYAERSAEPERRFGLEERTTEVVRRQKQELETAQKTVGGLLQFLSYLVSYTARVEGKLSLQKERNRELEERNQALELLLETDEMTSLLNKQGIEKRGEEELDYAKREGMPMAYLVLDLDNFKALNDRLGHAAGDEAIAEAGGLIAKEVRLYDVAARNQETESVGGRKGGDEFLIILQNTSYEHAVLVAERLRTSIEYHFKQESNLSSHFSDEEGGLPALTATIGVYGADASEIENVGQLFERADRYQNMKHVGQTSRDDADPNLRNKVYFDTVELGNLEDIQTKVGDMYGHRSPERRTEKTS